MSERFTDDGRAIVVAAQAEARSLRHEHVGTQHLLLALLRASDRIPAQALESLEVTYDEVREQVLRVVGEGGEGGDATGELPLTPRATRALEGAANEAVELEHERAGPEHILLSLVMDPTSLAARLLREFEVGPGDIRPTVLRLLPGTGPIHFERFVTRGGRPSDSWEEHYERFEDVDDSWTGSAGQALIEIPPTPRQWPLLLAVTLAAVGFPLGLLAGRALGRR